MKGLILLGMMVLFAGSAFAEETGNTIEDSFPVQKVDASEIRLKGKVKTLQAGDFLYFVRPPYRFKVKSVDSELEEVVVEAPVEHDLKPGVALLRFPSPQVKKSLKTQERLDEALN